MQRELTPRRPGRARPLVGLALTLAAGACFGSEAPRVEVEVVRAGDVTEVVSAPARVDAAARQDVTAGLSATVASIEIADGDTVTAGQPVVRLESRDVALANDQAEAARAAANGGSIEVEGSGAATRQATQEAVADLDATVPPQIAEARAAAQQVEDPEQRAAILSAVAALEASYRSTRAALLTAGAAVAAQQDASARALSEALSQVVEQAGAGQRAQAQAASAAAALQEDRLLVRAPFAGVVQLGNADPTSPLSLGGLAGAAGGAGRLGQLEGAAAGLAGTEPAAGGGPLRVGAQVSPGHTLFTVYDLSSLYVLADIDEVDIPQVEEGQRVTVLVDAFVDRSFGGVVESVPVAATTTQTGATGYQVRVKLTDEDLPALRVGMTAGAEIATRQVSADTVVPSRALLRRDGRTSVFVVEDATVRRVEVEVVALGEETAAVTGELARGDRVVVSGYEDLADGDRVEAGSDS